MITVNDLSKVPCNSNLAIATKQFVKPRRQNHVGILYKIDGSPISLLHLRWHHELRSEPPDPTYFWVPCQLDARLTMPFAEWLGVVWERNKAGIIPFSVQYTGRYFDLDGKFIRTGHGEGLTCATIVVALFADYGLPLIETTSWPKIPTLKDKYWHKRILEALQKTADPAHIVRQRPLLGRVSRYRPEQIAGAFGVFVGVPINHTAATALGQIVEDAIEIKD